MTYVEDRIGERGEVQKREDLTLVDSGKYYIASQTYKNLLILVRGFVG